MRGAFDTRAANFSPEQASVLSAAYHMALHEFSSRDRLPTNTKAKLAKVIVNLARERIRQKQELNVKEISSTAAGFLAQLRALSLLD